MNHAPPRRILLIAALLVGLVGWLMMRSYTSTGARQCEALYHASRTAADTARVDTTVTPGSRKQADPHSCGFIRRSARWH